MSLAAIGQQRAKVIVCFLAMLIAGKADGRTIVVTPGPNAIYYAVEASGPGDSLLVMPGMYPFEIGSDIDHSLTIIGVGGASMNEVKICSDLCLTYLFGVYSGPESVVSIEGLNITRSDEFPGTVQGIVGGTLGVLIIRRCIFHDLLYTAIDIGSGPVAPLIEHNLFHGDLIGVMIRHGSATIRNNTFASMWTGIILDGGATPNIANNVFANSFIGVLCRPSDPSPEPQFTCNDAWNNSMGNYYGCTDPTEDGGNISEDPRFCNSLGNDFRLLDKSPCLPENAPLGCGLIGALGGCQSAAISTVEAPPIEASFRVESNPVSQDPVFIMDDPGSVISLEIYDLSGRRLALLHPDARRVRWTSPPTQGRGVYFARAVTLEGSQTVKFVLIR